MKDIEINLKLILMMAFIIMLGGILLWAGYNLYVELLPKEEIKDFEGEWTSNVDNSHITQNNYNNTDFNLNDVIGEEDKFEINNRNSVDQKKGWVKRTYHYKGVGYHVMYYIPDDWEQSSISDEKNGVKINANMLTVDNLTSETTYDEFLKQFIETKEKTEFSPEGIENYVYYLEMSTSKDNYNEDLINCMNEIYSTFRIY